MPSQMFLRTALTENRIETLERQVEWIIKYLKVPPEPAQTDAEWEAAAPGEPGTEPNPEPVLVPDDPDTPVKRSKIAERIAKGKARG